MLLSAAHDFLPRSPSSHAAVVMDHFGIGFETGRHVIAEPFELPVEPGHVVAFTGPSGSGKSTLMRAAASQLDGALDIDRLDLGERLLIDAVALPPDESLPLLAACGLGEARLLLRTPRELSDGQRCRFRLALALSRKPKWIVADEFTATLDRSLAKIIAFNVRRQADRTGTGFFVATTHEDVLADLAPDIHVACRIDAQPAVSVSADAAEVAGVSRTEPAKPQAAERPAQKKKRQLSLVPQLELTEGAKSDYETFARWHYRSHHLGIVRFVTLLWHRTGTAGEPIGICVFTSAPLALRPRHRFFGINPRRTRTQIRVLDRQIVNLSRVVLHPSWRGAGVAALFVRRSCEACPWPWIETLAEMGHLNPFFERAGFVRVGATRPKRSSRQGYSSIYGTPRRGRKPIVTRETFAKSRFAEPVYYVFDNRRDAAPEERETAGGG